jgi:predicted DNA binding protein
MIVEFQFDTPLLRAALRESSVREVGIDQFDAAGSVPLRTVCWLESGNSSAFEEALAADPTVDTATQILDTDGGQQYEVRYDEQSPGLKLYQTAVEESGIFVSGVSRRNHWEVRMRFPDRDAFGRFRERVSDTTLSIQSIHQQGTEPRAERYDISPPQREILTLATERGYFEVPRRASLADLAEELGVSSQAASERLRRGLDSLVDRALLAPE